MGTWTWQIGQVCEKLWLPFIGHEIWTGIINMEEAALGWMNTGLFLSFKDAGVTWQGWQTRTSNRMQPAIVSLGGKTRWNWMKVHTFSSIVESRLILLMSLEVQFQVVLAILSKTRDRFRVHRHVYLVLPRWRQEYMYVVKCVRNMIMRCETRWLMLGIWIG